MKNTVISIDGLERGQSSIMPIILRIRFEIPKNQYKSSNGRDIPRVAAMKSAWLRAYGEATWAEAIRDQYDLKAIEPDTWTTAGTALTPSEREAYDALNAQKTTVDNAADDVSRIEAIIAADKAALKTDRDDHETRASLNAALYEIRVAKDRLKTEKTMLTRCRHAWTSAHGRQDRRRSATDRRAYVAAKISRNEERLLFPGRVRLDVVSHVITDRDFDAPNCWPTLKPLQDGGTDTGILWHDDSNRWIESTTFRGGPVISRDHYVIDATVTAADNIHDDAD